MRQVNRQIKLSLTHYSFLCHDFIILEKRDNAVPRDDSASGRCAHSNAGFDAEANGNIRSQYASLNRHVQSAASVPVDDYDAGNFDFWNNMGGSKDVRRTRDPLAAIGKTVAKEFYDEARGELRLYKGTVSGWDGTRYQILYTDDDQEDMSSNEVQLYNC